MGTVATVAVLVAAACRSAASTHDLDKVPLDGVFAECFELLEELDN